MPSVPTTGSPDIVSLDSKILSNLCDGNFYIDVTPSVYVSGRVDDVQGASIQITNPVGVIIKQYPTSGFDITPPMTEVVDFPIPLMAGNFQYGTYIISARVTDSIGDTWTVTKNVNICPPDPNNKNKKGGCINVAINGNCQTGKVWFLLSQPANYKGTAFSSQVNDLTVEYPTASGLPPFETTISSFSLNLYEGQYLVTGSTCVLYAYGDEVYFKVKYKVKCSKIIKCIIDECCVYAKFEELNLKIASDCTQAEKDDTASIILDAMRLLKTAELAANCGKDPSDYVAQLEALLGCVCTCNCNDGVPIIGNQAVTQFYAYRALLTQDATSAPTAVLDSANVIEILWTRTDVGRYTGTLIGTFTPLTVNNVFMMYAENANFKMKANYLSADSIEILVYNLSNVEVDDLLENTPFELSIF